ncbi:class I SAM-dependent methyltransferase [Agrobacterium salinitolerans]|uniref:class I SAM-dependent methyltransferase n=1 Tax=Agrobacterium salinitolerans TaxID=1183413 RepID=UPI0015727540|nr:methyltransferase domain-containing protein [Agrobacterium salinitolerans]NTA39814.1 methyltransferase domain-containing protein [Agrobacterium salinitolerans]
MTEREMAGKGNRNPAKLNIGCGPVIFDGWINIDIDHVDADVNADVTKGLEFEDNSVSFVFAEHFIEHLPRVEAVKFLKECRRVMRPGGVIRLSTPDLDELVDAYIARDAGRWGQLWQPINAAHMLNEAFYSWGHQFLYNREEMTALLKEAGLPNIRWCNHRQSIFKELSGLEARPFHNEIIVEAFQ